MHLFGEDNVKDNLTVLVSGSDKEWVEDNIEDLRTLCQGCDSFLSADFPPIEAAEVQVIDLESERDFEMCQEIRLRELGDAELFEHEMELRRRISLQELEDGLSSLRRCRTSCSIISRAKRKMEKVNAALTKDAMSFLKRLISESSRSGRDVDVRGNSCSASIRSHIGQQSNRYTYMNSFM